MVPYALVLVLSGLAIGIAERIWPLRPQKILRHGFARDLFYLWLNAEVVGSLIAIWLTGLIPPTLIQHWRGVLGLEALSAWHPAAQLALLFTIKDFLQWCVHNLMHRIPLLWEYHQVHHSSETLDWLSNWRFHWFEILVYQCVLYVPANLAGFTGEVTFGCAVISTVLGHFAHANLRWHIGPAKYVINCPELHWWHHVHPEYGPVNRNFAIGLSVWDWLFHTAHAPREAPLKLGIASLSSDSLKA